MARSLSGASWRFILNGIVSNATLYGLFVLLIYVDLDYRIAVSILYVLGILWNYTVNRLWSWKSEAKIASSFVKYLILYAVIYVLHLGLVIAMVERIGISSYLAPLLSMGLLLLPQMWALNRFVFAAPKQR